MKLKYMVFGQKILHGVLVLSEATVQSTIQCQCCDFNPDFFLNEEFLLLYWTERVKILGTWTCITHVSSKMSLAHILTAVSWLWQINQSVLKQVKRKVAFNIYLSRADEVAYNLMLILGPRPLTVTSYTSRQTESEMKLTFDGSQEIKPGLF